MITVSLLAGCLLHVSAAPAAVPAPEPHSGLRAPAFW